MFVNAAEFRVALTNLMFNAVESMATGGTLTLGLECVEGEIFLSVEDTGSGIVDECRERCFEPFYTNKLRGSGLGLSVCHGVIQRAGGTLDVESTRGVDTVFRIRLPDATEAGEVIAGPMSPKPTTPDPISVKILLVDDDPVVLGATRLMLQSCGADVVTAEGGAKAIKLYQQLPQFDLVMTDLGMSGVDGVQVVDAVRDQQSDQKIAIISGWSDQEVHRRFAESGLPDFVIHKPHTRIQLEEILSKVRRDPVDWTSPEVAKTTPSVDQA